MRERAAIILAAGKGTRMKSSVPKVLHKVGGRAVIDWSVDLARRLGCTKVVCVIAPDMPMVEEHLAARLGADSLVYQSPALGTGHAVRCAEEALAGFEGDVVVLFGDGPFIPQSAVEDLFGVLEAGAGIGVLGFEAAAPGMYGRLILADDGALEAIVEAREANREQLAVSLCNSSVMASGAKRMFELLTRVTNDNVKGEYYLTDLVGLARGDGLACRVVTCPEEDLMGCDTRADLAAAEAVFQGRKRAEMLENGVTMTGPETVFFSYDTEIEPDVEIEPHVVFAPGVRIASGARIRAFSHLEGAVIGAGSQIGPYARLRPGSVLEADVKIGNFVEVKNTHIAEGAKASHLSYLGDGEIGAEANIGAGTIFCNYDGFFKYKTVIGAGAFVGSNSALVAPVTIGEGAMIGSGSVITEDVSAGALALGRAKQAEKPGWAAKFREIMSARKKKKGKT